MTESTILRWLKSDDQPSDFYQLVGVPRLCQNQNTLVNAFDVGTDRCMQALLYSAGLHQPSARHLLKQISEARKIISDEARWQEYDQLLVERILDQYRQKNLDQPFHEDHFRHWLVEPQNVDPGRIEEIVAAWRKAPSKGASPPVAGGVQFQCKQCGQKVSAHLPPVKCKACGSVGKFVKSPSSLPQLPSMLPPSVPSKFSLMLTCPHCGFALNQVEIEDEEDFGSRTYCNCCGQPFNFPEQSLLSEKSSSLGDTPSDQVKPCPCAPFPSPKSSPPNKSEVSKKSDEDSPTTIEFEHDGFPIAKPKESVPPASSKRQLPSARPHPASTVEFGPDGFPAANFADASTSQSLALPKDVSTAKATTRGQFDTEESSKRDEVDCTVFCPLEVAQGESMMVQVLAHLPENAEEAETKAKKFDRSAEERGATSLGTEIARGSKLVFKLQMDRVKVDPDTQTLVWRGRTASVQFLVVVPKETTIGSLIATLVVSQDSIPIGTIVFNVAIGERASSTKPKPQIAGVARRYQKAFISYASQNRNEVLRRIQMLSRVGIETFFDLFSLKAGDAYSDKLLEYIDQSDVMFLFWSTAAKKSAWVEKEWRYGLAHKPEGYIQPVIIEGPPVPLPPPELEHLHFNDTVIYFVSESLLSRLWRRLKGRFAK